MRRIVERFRWVGVAALIAGYALMVHHVNVSGQSSSLGAALAVAPPFGFVLAMLVNPVSRLSGIVLLGGGAWASWRWWDVIAQHAGVLFWIQDAGLMLTLLIAFGRTLMPGHKPLCVGFAEMLHGPLDEMHERYARQVTVVWTLFFAVMAAVSTLLFFFAPLPVWSFFSNFLVLPLVALMFAAEYLVRRRVLPASSGRMLDAVRAYMQSSTPSR